VTDTTNPVIIDAQSDLSVEYGYTGQSLSWTATDANPSIYTITLVGTGLVAGPTAWSSGVAITYNVPDGVAITYNVPDGLTVGEYIYTVNFTDDYDNFVTDSVTFTVEDTTNPVITDAPTDLIVEYDYTGQSLSWTATDANPSIYTITLVGTGLVAGPTAWTSAIAITYNIPDGLAVGDYTYTVNFTDIEGNNVTDSVTFTVEDTTNPVITDAPTDLTVEYGYTGQSLSWTATDANPSMYTIELQGTGIVIGPTAWTSGIAITYNIPDGFTVGDYVYTVNFTDTETNYNIDNVTYIVEDTTNPVLSVSPNNFIVEFGYSGQSFSWTVTDLNPNSYTIELQGSGIIAGPISWTSGIAITYNIPDGLGVSSHIYMVNFTDDYGNFITDNVTFTVRDTTDPVIINSPSDLTLEVGYMGESLDWTTTDANPDTYEIALQGTGTVVGPLSWTSGVAITYNIPDGLAVGVYVYTITFTDDYGNFVSDLVTVTINSGSVTPPPPGGISFGLTFLIFLGISLIGLIFAKRKQLLHKSL